MNMQREDQEETLPRSNRLKAFFRYYKPHLKWFILDMVCALGIALIDLAFPIVTRNILQVYLPEGLLGDFAVALIFMALGYGARCGLSYVVTYWGHMMGVLIEADMRRDIFTHLQRLSFRFYDKNRTGRLMSRVTTDLFDITELAHHGPEDVFISLVTLLGAFIYLFSMRWELALPLMIITPLILWFAISQRTRMRNASRAVKDKMAGINADLESSISGVRVAKAFANEPYEIKKFGQGNERFKTAKNGFYSAMAIFHSGMELMLNLLGVVALLTGGLLLFAGHISLADMVAYNLFVATIQAPIRRLTNFTEQYTTGMAGFSRFMEILEEQPDIADAPDAVTLPQVQGEIAFKGVTFFYDEGVNVLSDVNLHVPAGRMLALVGPSGGGKTTLCQLIPRFYEIQAGSITLDGKDIRQIRLDSLRGHIGIVQQDVFLFAGSVLDNIRYGRVDATLEEVVQAARMAEIHEDILAMPEGYDTQVGERGVMLSGGQKQRVSIARIFLKNPRILILDEATSALDTATEVKIQAAFDRLAKGRTTLVIAHRLSTIRNADEIVVIDEQGIREQGPHDQLLAQHGEYAALYHAQFRQQEASLVQQSPDSHGVAAGMA